MTSLLQESLVEVVRRVDDLEAENVRLKAQLGTAQRVFGESFTRGKTSLVGPQRPNRKKLTEREVREIRKAHSRGMTQGSLAASYGVNPATISRLVRGIYHR